MSKIEKLLSQIEKFSERYEFNFQFWGAGNNNVYIMKHGVDLYDSGWICHLCFLSVKELR